VGLLQAAMFTQDRFWLVVWNIGLVWGNDGLSWLIITGWWFGT
jgi:hypothetical protein